MVKTLANGIRIITNLDKNAYSATVGIWARVGSVDEDEKTSGISHCIEHMLFKGTKDKTAKQIAFEMDSVGGQLNAFTGKEYTCYHATVTFEHVEKAFLLLADMVKNSLLDQSELDKERGVILEEISMGEDSPEDVVHELHSKTFFEGTALCEPIIGNKKTVSSFSSADLKKYMDNQYDGNRLVISIAGRFDEEQLIKLIEGEFSEYKTGVPNSLEYSSGIIKRADNLAVKNMPVEQVHMCLGFPGVDLFDDDIYSFYIFNSILGGSMSSRLFQTIREEHALCYTVYSFTSAYMNNGCLTVYSATNKDQVKRLVELTVKEIEAMVKSGPTKDEIQMAKDQMKGNYLLALESSTTKMISYGKSLLLTGKTKTPEEVLARINAVDCDIMMDMVRSRLTRDQMTASFVGNLDYDECAKFLK